MSTVFATLWLVGMAGAVGAAWQAKYHRLAALTMMAIAGLATCLTFVWFSAPDLALTQLAVEIVTTVLFLLGLALAAQAHSGRSADDKQDIGASFTRLGARVV
jgi:multicomponent K+:H+ antiporter subunit A